MPGSSSSPSTPVSIPKPKRRVPRSFSVSYVSLLTDIVFIRAKRKRKRFLVNITPCSSRAYETEVLQDKKTYEPPTDYKLGHIRGFLPGEFHNCIRVQYITPASR